jgi:hypothetical protein
MAAVNKTLERKAITRLDEVSDDKRYLITTPKNPFYDGKTAGVQFSNGSAMFDPAMIDKTLGETPAGVVRRFLDLQGYVVEEVN